MKRVLTIIGLALAVSVMSLSAQSTGVAGQKLAWDQAGPDLATVQTWSFRYYPDGATTSNPFNGVVCAGTVSPFQCEVLIPAFTPGSHSLTVTATNVAGESPKSAPFAFTFVVTPGAPANIHIK